MSKNLITTLILLVSIVLVSCGDIISFVVDENISKTTAPTHDSTNILPPIRKHIPKLSNARRDLRLGTENRTMMPQYQNKISTITNNNSTNSPDGDKLLISFATKTVLSSVPPETHMQNLLSQLASVLKVPNGQRGIKQQTLLNRTSKRSLTLVNNVRLPYRPVIAESYQRASLLNPFTDLSWVRASWEPHVVSAR